MRAILRTVVAIAAGLVATFILVVAIAMLSAVVHPFPENFGGTPEEVSRHVERYPAWLLALAIPAWGVAALIGTWTAGKLGNRWSAMFLGLLLLSAVALNISMLPYPLWFEAACLIVIPAAAVCGHRVAGRRARVAATLSV